MSDQAVTDELTHEVDDLIPSEREPEEDQTLPPPTGDEDTSPNPLSEAERGQRDYRLGRFRHVERASLYQRARIVWECKEMWLWRDHGTWAEFCRRGDGLDLDLSQADELVRIEEARQLLVLEISRTSAPMPLLPTRAYYWRPIVTDAPRVTDATQIARILHRAVDLAGPGRLPHWAEYSQAKDEVLDRPHRRGWFPGLDSNKRKHTATGEGATSNECGGQESDMGAGGGEDADAGPAPTAEDERGNALAEALMALKSGESESITRPDPWQMAERFWQSWREEDKEALVLHFAAKLPAESRRRLAQTILHDLEETNQQT